MWGTSDRRMISVCIVNTFDLAKQTFLDQNAYSLAPCHSHLRYITDQHEFIFRRQRESRIPLSNV